MKMKSLRTTHNSFYKKRRRAYFLYAICRIVGVNALSFIYLLVFTGRAHSAAINTCYLHLYVGVKCGPCVIRGSSLPK